MRILVLMMHLAICSALAASGGGMLGSPVMAAAKVGSSGSTSGATAGAAFTPAAPSGLVLWLDANNSGSITQSGGFVSQWNDLSPTGAVFKQTTAAQQPKYIASGIGGSPALSMIQATGGNGVLIDAGTNTYIGTGASPFTIWTVVQANNTGGNGFVVIAEFPPATNPEFGFDGSNASYSNLYFAASAGFSNVKSNTSFDETLSAPYAITITYDGAGNYAFYSAGVSQTVGGAGAGGSGVTKLSIGASGPTGLDPSYLFAEIAIYNRVLSGSEIAQIQTYSHGKYGL